MTRGLEVEWRQEERQREKGRDVYRRLVKERGRDKVDSY